MGKKKPLLGATILKNQITLKNNGENIEYEDRFSAI